MKSIKNKLSKLKNKISWLKVIWFKNLKSREDKSKAFSDEEIIKRGYKAAFGEDFDLENPELFYEKLNWMKLNYRNPLMPIVSDKYLVHQYLKDLGYGHLLNNILGVWDNVKDFDVKQLPERFVLKATHASGDAWNLIVKDKRKFNWFATKKVMNQWLKNSIEWLGREWHYGEMTPRIICEEYLEDESGELRDFKFHCFNGQPMFVTLCTGRFTGNKQFLTFAKEWNLLPLTTDAVYLKANNISNLPEKPQNLDEMWKLASELSQPFPYVRVDFYNVNGKIYFGEFTFFDFGAFKGPYTLEAQKLIGDKLILPKANK